MLTLNTLRILRSWFYWVLGFGFFFFQEVEKDKGFCLLTQNKLYLVAEQQLRQEVICSEHDLLSIMSPDL